MDRKTLRSHLNFEVLGKLFFDLADERYPSSEKVTQLVARLIDPISADPLENVVLKIAVLNAMRDMVKQVSPTLLYRSLQHRDELFGGIIEALEDLEDHLEELEIAQEEEEEDG
jgi:hypothetical protein